MDPMQIRDEARDYLNSGVKLEDVARHTEISRSWLSKFRRGEIVNPTVKQLALIHEYRQQTDAR